MTGGSGFVGRHLIRAAGRRWEIVAPPSAALDVNDADRLLTDLREWRPGVVVHLAYRKADPRTIVGGSTNVARAAAAIGARLVHLSTDAVFAGRAAPYAEDDPPARSRGAGGTDYGLAKLAAEEAVAEACPDALIVRTSLVYGTWLQARIQQDLADAIAGRSAMTFFTDEVRCPIAGDDLAGALLALGRRRAVRGVLNVAGPEPVTRAELARLFARWMGLDPTRVPIGTIAAAGLERPGRVVLDCTRAEALGLRARSPEDVLGPST